MGLIFPLRIKGGKIYLLPIKNKFILWTIERKYVNCSILVHSYASRMLTADYRFAGHGFLA